ncbi:MAG TPA: cytochrome c oxidase assembly protein [Polyangiaceae bacterium]|nr:cytochrome c oxidase assembly protein [Polyangiaceae bacterium]
MDGLLVLAVVVLALYFIGVVRRLRSGAAWSAFRSASFPFGMGLVLAALAPPLATLGHTDLRMHMVQHLMLGMLGPVGIVLGAPVTLALSQLPAPTARRVVRVLHSRPARLVAHPVTALALNIGGMAGLYLTPLFARMLHDPALHLAVHVHFLAAGCVFSWAIAGTDPGPARPRDSQRIAVLFGAIAAHATLAKAMFAYGFPRGTPFDIEAMQDAAKIMYYGGDLSELLLAIALFASLHAKRGQRVAKSPVRVAAIGRA